MDDTRQERNNEGPTLKLNKQENWTTRQWIYGLSGLEKINSIAFLEVKLFRKAPLPGVKN